MRSHMMLQTEQVGDMAVNCYIFCNKDTKKCIIFDPGAEGNLIRGVIDANGMTPEAILLTHGHFDHIGAIDTLKGFYPNIEVYAGYEERMCLSDIDVNLSGMFGRPCTVNADHYFEDQERFEMIGAHFKCIFTPGHTKGSVCFYAIEDEFLISGDTLFAGSVGRTDFPGGDSKELLTSIRQRLDPIPDYIRVYPGHGPATTMEIERAENPFM
ncbi:MAG: MBL fold metallo-hydrolase [Lachnospiraceae bacterium]|nr:MBL fold metallo-hydrolase [Lachnospiraceae bacterium]